MISPDSAVADRAQSISSISGQTDRHGADVVLVPLIRISEHRKFGPETRNTWAVKLSGLQGVSVANDNVASKS